MSDERLRPEEGRIGPLPRVVGSLGPVGSGDLAALRRVVGIEAEPMVHVSDVATLVVADPRSACVSSRRGRVSWALSPFTTDQATLEFDRTTAELRGDDAGLVPLYYLAVEGGFLFADRIDPLVRAGIRRVHADWSAWAGILTASLPVGDRTPFEEVRRLLPDRCLRVAQRNVEARGRTWRWAEMPAVGPPPGSAQILDMLRDELAPLAGSRVVLPLSGGWDSRLMGALLAEPPGTAVDAVTVDTDGGHRVEQRYATAVAEHLGFGHRVIPPDLGRSFVDDARQVAEALDYQTGFHVWGLELQMAYAGDRPVIDGLAGGVLLRNTFVTPQFEQASGPRERLDAIWDRLAASVAPGRLTGTAAGRAIEAEARATYRRWSAPLEGHHADAKLAVYGTRTLRAIALATSQLWGKAAPMVAPFATERVAELGLQLPSDVRDPNERFRALLAAVDPVLVELPSMNTAPAPRRYLARRELSDEAHRWYREQLAHESVVGSLAPGALGFIRSGGTWLTGPTRKLSQPVRGLALLASWLQTYETYLVDVEPSWTERRSPRTRHANGGTNEPLKVARDDLDDPDWWHLLETFDANEPTARPLIVRARLRPSDDAPTDVASRLLGDLMGAGLQPDRVRIVDGDLRVVASRSGDVDAVGPMRQLVRALEDAHGRLGREVEQLTVELEQVRRSRRDLLRSRWWRLGQLVAALRRPNRWPLVPRRLADLVSPRDAPVAPSGRDRGGPRTALGSRRLPPDRTAP